MLPSAPLAAPRGWVLISSGSQPVAFAIASRTSSCNCATPLAGHAARPPARAGGAVAATAGRLPIALPLLRPLSQAPPRIASISSIGRDPKKQIVRCSSSGASSRNGRFAPLSLPGPGPSATRAHAQSASRTRAGGSIATNRRASAPRFIPPAMLAGYPQRPQSARRIKCMATVVARSRMSARPPGSVTPSG